MASLAWIWKQIGVDSEPWRYDGTIPIPLGGQALVMLRDANGAQPQYNPNLLTVTKVGPDQASAELIHYLRDLGLRGDVYLGLKHEIERTMSKELHDGSGKLFSVKGNVVCETDLRTGTNGNPTFTSPYVKVFTPPRRYKVSFRFLARHPYVEDEKLSYYERVAKKIEYKYATPETSDVIWTRRNTTEVDAWISHLNWIYGSQAGIKFELGTAEGFYSEKPLTSALKHDEIEANFANLKDRKRDNRDNNADFTVFLPGPFHYDTDDSGVYAATFHPDSGSWVTAIADHPRYSYIKYPDQFICALAHELSHAIRKDKDELDLEEGVSCTKEDKGQNTKIGPLLREVLLHPKP